MDTTQIETPALPRVTAYAFDSGLLDPVIPEPIRCQCTADITWTGFRVAGERACCRDCAIERVCELLGAQEIYDDGAEALAVECVEGAL